MRETRVGERVLVMGQGLIGLLVTNFLAIAGARVLAIEKDARLAAVLAEREAGRPGLELMVADALQWLRAGPHDWSGWRVVANLPYSVASPILVELAAATAPPVRMVVTVQFEVARRLMASAGTADYGVLTLLVQQAFEPRGWFKIPAACFFPVPDVDSACVTLERRAPPPCQHPKPDVPRRALRTERQRSTGSPASGESRRCRSCQ